MKGPDAQLAEHFAKFAPAIAKLGRALRAKLRARLPGLTEIVYFYANQGALVITYSPTGRGYEGLCSLALYPDKVQLHFGQGARLAHADSAKLLQGRGKTVRHVELNTLADFDRREVEGLMSAALELAGLRLAAGTQGALVFKDEEQKERARKTGAKKTAKKTGKKTAKKP